MPQYVAAQPATVATKPIKAQLHVGSAQHTLNTSAVRMQSRGGAARAKDELNGVLLHQQELKLGWGKAVAMPAVPLYAGTAAGTPAKGEQLS